MNREAQSTDATRPPLALLSVILFFWGLLFVAGFPPPSWDDLFFLGSAVELHETHRLANPWLRFWNPVAAERYFFHPAFHSYVLAGWISLCGLSTRSLLAFQCLAGAVASVSSVLLLRRYGFRGGAVVPVLIALILLSQGIRPNALGLAFLATGLLLLSGRRATRQFFGLCLLGASVATWTVLLVYAVPLGAAVAAGDWLRKDSRTPWYALRRLSLAVAAALVTGILFLASIGFRLSEFLADFSWHARLRRVTDLGSELRFQLTNGYAEILFIPLYLLFFVLVSAAVLRWRDLRPTVRVCVGALLLAMVANLLVYARSMHYVFDLFAWVGVVVLAGELPTREARRRAAAAAIGIFILTQSYSALHLFTTRREPASSYLALRAKIPAGSLVGVDETAARHVFDYRLPPSAFFWNYSVPPPSNWPGSVQEKQPGTIWALSLTKSGVTEGLPEYERVRVLDREFRSLPARPGQVILLGPERIPSLFAP